jgi:DHA2 family methylenomycin A resistance protein-like MFS transporter
MALLSGEPPGAGGTRLRSAAVAIVAAGVAAASAVGLIVTERRVADPLLPPALFTCPAFRAVTASALIMNLTSNGLLFLLTRYLQSILGHSPLTAGLMLLPLFAPLAVTSPLAGRLTARHGPRPVMLAGAAIAAGGQLCLLLVTPATGYPRLVPALLGVGFGVGLFTAPVVAAAMRAVPPERSGLASGINNTARRPAPPSAWPSSARSRAVRGTPDTSSPPCAGSGSPPRSAGFSWPPA